VVDAQERERKRISMELHDEAGQAMTALKISLQLLRDELDVDVVTLRRNLDQAIDLVDTTRERIRLLAHNLRPPALETLGLNDTLEDFCSQFAARTRLDIGYRGEEITDLSDAQEICLYRLLQEALANIAVHARATAAEVALQRQRSVVQLTVADNGRGMDPASLDSQDGSGIGLLGMRERLEMIGGHLKIESRDNGTTLIAAVPIRR
jgi:signal transduction histidine kinase